MWGFLGLEVHVLVVGWVRGPSKRAADCVPNMLRLFTQIQGSMRAPERFRVLSGTLPLNQMCNTKNLTSSKRKSLYPKLYTLKTISRKTGTPDPSLQQEIGGVHLAVVTSFSWSVLARFSGLLSCGSFGGPYKVKILKAL